jgi:uncharacterized protein (TIGR02145 family)
VAPHLQFSQFWHLLKDPAAPYILYWDATTGTMQLGKWTTQGGAANQSNLLFFKFGGVVGFTNVVAANGTAWPGASAVKLNPMTGSPAYASYGDIPCWEDTDQTGYISSTNYHTKANVLAGRGDPCKLVGLTVAQIQAGAIDNGEFRLPTSAEIVAEYSSATHVAGNGWVANTLPTAGIHTGTIGTSFLPAAGLRNINGATFNVGLYGYYWSSHSSSATSVYHMYFTSVSVFTSAISTAQAGRSVRCVPQS